MKLDEIEAMARGAKQRSDKATKGPWEWWTSCSYRRLSANGNGDVAHATVHPKDGWPDIRISEEDMVFIATARTDVPVLADAAEQLAPARQRPHPQRRSGRPSTRSGLVDGGRYD